MCYTPLFWDLCYLTTLDFIILEYVYHYDFMRNSMTLKSVFWAIGPKQWHVQSLVMTDIY